MIIRELHLCDRLLPAVCDCFGLGEGFITVVRHSGVLYNVEVQVSSTYMLSKDISYTQVRANLAETLNDVEDNRSVVVVRRKGRPGVALIAEEELSSLMETVYLLRSPANARRLFEAIEEVKAGEYETADSIEALAEELGFEQKA